MLIGAVGGACAQPPDHAPRDRSSPESGPAVLGATGAPTAAYALEGGAGPGRAGARGLAPYAGERALPAGADVPAHDAERDPSAGAGAGAAGAGAAGAGAAGAPAISVGRAASGVSAGTPGSASPFGTNPALAFSARETARSQAVRLAFAHRWGLSVPPLIAPAPPERRLAPGALRGLSGSSGLPPVIARVPTSDRVVFLTIDDGVHKDPRLIRMLRELGVPVSAFLSDYVVRDDYDYFRQLQSLGVAINNHTINHEDLLTLSYRGQRKEICRQQDTIEREFGVRPRIFRPPYGNWDRDTLRAARSCGITVVPLWSQEAFARRIEYGGGEHRFRPGDIILTHFRGKSEWDGTMPDMVRRVIRAATSQGFALARLEDYI
ncbi:polysaccharide deacetylase family protein [Streptomyces sp. NPDC051776]|uniref:polysaccharide deacetylase family protein n=1 Tax=Streptomyces sp. NPDC051776 TaxID=3155414 RepID=UPI0034360D81